MEDRHRQGGGAIAGVQGRGNRHHRQRAHDQRGTLPHAPSRRGAEVRRCSTWCRAPARATIFCSAPTAIRTPAARSCWACAANRAKLKDIVDGINAKDSRGGLPRRGRSPSTEQSPGARRPAVPRRDEHPAQRHDRRRHRRLARLGVCGKARVDDQRQGPPPASQPRDRRARRRARRLGNPARPHPGARRRQRPLHDRGSLQSDGQRHPRTRRPEPEQDRRPRRAGHPRGRKQRRAHRGWQPRERADSSATNLTPPLIIRFHGLAVHIFSLPRSSASSFW